MPVTLLDVLAVNMDGGLRKAFGRDSTGGAAIRVGVTDDIEGTVVDRGIPRALGGVAILLGLGIPVRLRRAAVPGVGFVGETVRLGLGVV